MFNQDMLNNLYKNHIVNTIFFIFPFTFFRYSLNGIDNEFLLILLKTIGSYLFYTVISLIIVLGIFGSRKFIKKYLFFLASVTLFILLFYDFHNFLDSLIEF